MTFCDSVGVVVVCPPLRVAISNHYVDRVNNGFAEGVNNKIKLVLRLHTLGVFVFDPMSPGTITLIPTKVRRAVCQRLFFDCYDFALWLK